MKTDLYTKTVLTVIAICLTFIVIKQTEIIPTANANESTVNLNNKVNYGLVPLNEDGSINVNIKSVGSTMDVNIVEVGGFSTFGTVPVKLKN